MEYIEIIRSKDNSFFKKIKSYAQAKYRNQDKVLLAEGTKLFADALATLTMQRVVVSESYYDNNQDKLEEFDQRTLTIFDDRLFAQLSELKTDQGILGIFEQPTFDLDFADTARLIVLEGVQDPSNVGAIIRNAHCLGYELVVLGKGCAHPFSPKVIRSSMGSVFHVPVISLTSSDHMLQQLQGLKDIGFSIVGTAAHGKEVVPAFNKLALLIGSEGSGLSQQSLDMCDYIYRIKIQESAESLNAAVASGIAMYLLK